MKQVHLLFATPVVTIDNFLSQPECRAIAQEVLSNPGGTHYTLDNGSTTTYSTGHTQFIQQLARKYAALHDLPTRVENAFQDYAYVHGIDSLVLANSWANTQTSGSHLQRHNHPRAVVSGALYVNVDANSSGLHFYNPNPFSYYEDVRTPTPYNERVHRIQPQNGQLVLFPGWLSHGSAGEENQTSNRIVVSMNGQYPEFTQT